MEAAASFSRPAISIAEGQAESTIALPSPRSRPTPRASMRLPGQALAERKPKARTVPQALKIPQGLLPVL